MILPLLLSLILTLLGVLHLSWAFGGTYSFAASLPTTLDGKIVLSPRKIDCAIVSISLIALGLFYLWKSKIIILPLPQWLWVWPGWIIPGIFMLRAIGDFKYVGFFKKLTQTPFGRRDTRFFSPLCMIMGIMGFIIQVPEAF